MSGTAEVPTAKPQFPEPRPVHMLPASHIEARSGMLDCRRPIACKSRRGSDRPAPGRSCESPQGSQFLRSPARRSS